MSAAEVAWFYGAMLATVAIPSAFPLAALRGAGPRYRATLVRQLAVGWAAAAVFVGWLTLGWFALQAGGRGLALYRDVSLVLIGAYVPLLVMGIRAGNRALAAAQAADRGVLPAAH